MVSDTNFPPSGPRSPLARELLPPPLEQVVEDDERGADRDRRIGDVERREAPSAVVHANEVDHVSPQHAIDDVAERTAEDEREAGREHALPSRRQPPQPDQNADADRNGKDREEPALPSGSV